MAYRERGDLSFTPPGHKQGRGIDDRTAAVLGRELFAADVMTMNGLDDRMQSGGLLQRAQQLMAEAVGADHAFFSTCGSSLSVKTSAPGSVLTSATDRLRLRSDGDDHDRAAGATRSGTVHARLEPERGPEIDTGFEPAGSGYVHPRR